MEKPNHRETRKKFEEELKDSLEQVYMEESDPTEQWTKIKEAMRKYTGTKTTKGGKGLDYGRNMGRNKQAQNN
jgi:lipoate-protein ligase A